MVQISVVAPVYNEQDPTLNKLVRCVICAAASKATDCEIILRVSEAGFAREQMRAADASVRPASGVVRADMLQPSRFDEEFLGVRCFRLTPPMVRDDWDVRSAPRRHWSTSVMCSGRLRGGMNGSYDSRRD